MVLKLFQRPHLNWNNMIRNLKSPRQKCMLARMSQLDLPRDITKKRCWVRFLSLLSLMKTFNLLQEWVDCSIRTLQLGERNQDSPHAQTKSLRFYLRKKLDPSRITILSKSQWVVVWQQVNSWDRTLTTLHLQIELTSPILSKILSKWWLLIVHKSSNLILLILHKRLGIRLVRMIYSKTVQLLPVSKIL